MSYHTHACTWTKYDRTDGIGTGLCTLTHSQGICSTGCCLCSSRNAVCSGSGCTFAKGQSICCTGRCTVANCYGTMTIFLHSSVISQSDCIVGSNRTSLSSNCHAVIVELIIGPIIIDRRSIPQCNRRVSPSIGCITDGYACFASVYVHSGTVAITGHIIKGATDSFPANGNTVFSR